MRLARRELLVRVATTLALVATPVSAIAQRAVESSPRTQRLIETLRGAGLRVERFTEHDYARGVSRDLSHVVNELRAVQHTAEGAVIESWRGIGVITRAGEWRSLTP